MDVYEFFREYARMFKTYRKGVTITNMYITVEGILPPEQEVSFEFSTTQEQIDKIIQWSKNHPKKTRLQDFKEKYPNATFEKDSEIPHACCDDLGYCFCKSIKGGGPDGDCKKCWNEPVE